jgi:replicative DNA helicase
MRDPKPGEIQNKQVPSSPEAEAALLGSVLIDPETYDAVSQVVKGEDFYLHRHRFIWDAITHLQERRSPLDFLTLCDELDQTGKLAEIGGTAYLTELIDQVPSSLHAETYALIIQQSAVRRRILEAASKIAQLAFNEGTPLEKVIDESETAIYAASSQSLKHTVQPFSQVLDELQAHLEHKEDSGMPTGFSELDRMLYGLQPADLVVIAGRPGTGKTSFLLSVVRHAARMLGKHIVFFTLETSREQLALRLLAQETGIEVQRLRSGELELDERRTVSRATENLKAMRLFLEDTTDISMHQVQSICRKLHKENRLDLVVLDYLQLMDPGGNFENRVQEVSSITRQLKALARELYLPVLAAAQLSRAVEQRADKRPLLSDLRESGSIEMDADVVLFLCHPEEIDVTGQVEIKVAKHRNGPTGIARLIFLKKLAMFQDAVVDGGR